MPRRFHDGGLETRPEGCRSRTYAVRGWPRGTDRAGRNGPPLRRPDRSSAVLPFARFLPPAACLLRHGRRNLLLDLHDGHDRQQFRKQEEPEEEPPEASGRDAEIDPSRFVKAPRVRIVVARERGDDDDESFEPHSDVDEETDGKQP